MAEIEACRFRFSAKILSISNHATKRRQRVSADPIQESLLKLIAQKKKQLKPRKAAKGKKTQNAGASNVVNIMDALRKSVDADLKKKKAG